MKTENHAVAAAPSVDPARRQEAFEGLMSRIAGRFARVEPRRRARDLALGLLSDLPRKNCWSIAEWAGQASPDGMQHLLGRTKWDADAVREIQRLFTTLVVRSALDAAQRLCWPAWRRRHQARAQASHYRRRAANQT